MREETNQPRSPLSGTAVLVIISCLIVAVLAFKTFRMGEISGAQIGVILDKMTGKMEVIPESGVHIYNSITNEFFILDKTVQTIEMTERPGQGDRRTKDDLKVKTVDGSDVYVDLQVRYQIIEDMADVVLRTSGTGDAFKQKWMRDYVRAVARNTLGELTTEEFYNSSKRAEKANKAKDIINKKTEPFGLRISDIGIPQTPHFYEAYEAMIKKKKLADQEELEERSLASAASQRQKTEIQIAMNNKRVALTKAKGQMEQDIIKSTADGQRIEAEARAYSERVKVGADAELYRLEKQAQAILAARRSEAKGILALKNALEGEGGRNMVKLEYAKKLKDVEVTAIPVTKAQHVQRFEVDKPAVVK